MDVTGDGVIDLVLTEDCTDDGVGTSQWRVYPGGPSGFADAPVAWSLPTLAGAAGTLPLGELSQSRNCTEADRFYQYTTMDATGDGVIDLVLTEDCTDDGVGTSQWRVYPGVCE
ncbi:hypothetical protein [Nannocystis radixulma]|uniref:Repeat domain-containing protein n=1 Tax=Nannocystis radixulma TaxID=2995305 RepID=A0ABT5BP92_9BACT|nr:hypothetical protein [Nannocystis radixulma]MDC0675992.1 hypothetical protein [Nannocystis radixulma]